MVNIEDKSGALPEVFCSRCGSNHIQKIGCFPPRKQRWRCVDCGKSFYYDFFGKQKICKYCGRGFVEKGNKIFCCNKCRANYWKVQYHTDPELRRHILEITRGYWSTRPHIRWANYTIQSHIRRGFNIQFTREALSKYSQGVSNCPYCGSELNYKGGNGMKNHFSSNSASLDIKNPDYVKKRAFGRVFFDDVQIICMRCNSAKNRTSEKEFFTWVSKLEIHRLYMSNKKCDTKA